MPVLFIAGAVAAGIFKMPAQGSYSCVSHNFRYCDGNLLKVFMNVS